MKTILKVFQIGLLTISSAYIGTRIKEIQYIREEKRRKEAIENRYAAMCPYKVEPNDDL